MDPFSRAAGTLAGSIFAQRKNSEIQQSNKTNQDRGANDDLSPSSQ